MFSIYVFSSVLSNKPPLRINIYGWNVCLPIFGTYLISFVLRNLAFKLCVSIHLSQYMEKFVGLQYHHLLNVTYKH